MTVPSLGKFLISLILYSLVGVCVGYVEWPVGIAVQSSGWHSGWHVGCLCCQNIDYFLKSMQSVRLKHFWMKEIWQFTEHIVYLIFEFCRLKHVCLEQMLLLNSSVWGMFIWIEMMSGLSCRTDLINQYVMLMDFYNVLHVYLRKKCECNTVNVTV